MLIFETLALLVLISSSLYQYYTEQGDKNILRSNLINNNYSSTKMNLVKSSQNSINIVFKINKHRRSPDISSMVFIHLIGLEIIEH